MKIQPYNLKHVKLLVNMNILLVIKRYHKIDYLCQLSNTDNAILIIF
jgi:hypothetical protein